MLGPPQRPVQLAARQGIGWFERAELHAVRAWQPARLRQLARHGQRWLELQRRTAVLHQVGGQPQPVPGSARIAVPPVWRSADGAGGTMAEPAGPVVRRGRLRGDGLSESRHQRQAPDRLHGGAGNNVTDPRGEGETKVVKSFWFVKREISC